MKTSWPFLPVVTALLALGMGGCSTPAARIRRNSEAFARLPAPEQALIRNGQIGLGFTPEMVRLALGDPDQVYTRTDPGGTSEIWSYTSYDPSFEPDFYSGWYGRRRRGGWDGPFYADPLYPGHGYRQERVDFRVVFKDGKAVAVEQRRR